MNRSSTILIWLAMLALLVGCTPERVGDRGTSNREGPAPSTPKRLRVAIMSDPPLLSFKLNPVSNVPGVDALDDLMHVGLSTIDTSNVMQPRLAEAVPSLENGLWTLLPDGGMQTTWKIRPNAFWHDGEPFTSADLIFTTTVDQDRTLPTSRDFTYDLIESVSAPDPVSITVVWKQTFVEADTMFSPLRGFPLPRHLLETGYGTDPASFLQLPYWSTEFVGTGPFRLREWVRGSHLLLDSNDRYVLGKPRIDEIEVRFIPDSNALVANILAASAELTLGRSLSLEQATQVRDQWRDGTLMIGLRSWISVYPQMLNPSPAIVADVQFRRALMHAVDRQQLVDTLEQGLVSVAHSYVSPKEPEYRDVEPFLVRYEYDPRKAAELIAARGGFSRDPDGAFRDNAGERLSVEIRTTAGDDTHAKTMFAVADSWQRVGIEAKPVISPTQRARDLEYRATFPALEVARQPNELSYDALTRLHGAQTPLPETNFVGRNRMRYRNAEFDRLIDRFLTTIPRAERAQILGQVMGHMTDQVVPLGMFYDAHSTLVGNRLVNVVGGSAQGTYAWNAHEWDVRS